MRHEQPSSWCAAIAICLAVAACQRAPGPRPDAEIGGYLSTQILGSADDADSTTPRDTYSTTTNTGDMDATDQRCKASSKRATPTRLSGKAEAEPFDPGAATTTGDEARSTSFNKVVSRLTVRNNTNVTFDIVLDVDEVELRGGGKVTIQVLAAVLNDQGTSVANGGVTNTTFEFVPSGGSVNVIIGGDTANPDATDADNSYERTLSGPNRGVNLNAGRYRLEFDLRITATAPVHKADDGTRDRAAVKNVKATIMVR